MQMNKLMEKITLFNTIIKVHQDSKILFSIIVMVFTYPIMLYVFVDTLRELKIVLIVYSLLFLLAILRYGKHRLEASIFIDIVLDVATIFYAPANPITWVKATYTIACKGSKFIKTESN